MELLLWIQGQSHKITIQIPKKIPIKSHSSPIENPIKSSLKSLKKTPLENPIIKSHIFPHHKIPVVSHHSPVDSPFPITAFPCGNPEIPCLVDAPGLRGVPDVGRAKQPAHDLGRRGAEGETSKRQNQVLNMYETYVYRCTMMYTSICV